MGVNGSGESRPTYGALVAALGAGLLAVAVFLPWYGVSFTAHGLATVQQVQEQFGQQYGNAALQSLLGGLHSTFGALVGHEFTSLSAHQALSTLNVVLLIIAGLSVLIALLALVGPDSAASEANRGPLALLGLIGAACVVFRMVSPPSPAGDYVALSLREGAWLALLGCACIAGGAMWHGSSARSERSGAEPGGSGAGEGAGVWSELSGWTPET
ncbi:MAG TPA: hypothetical protein VL988_03675 [Solirubrobacteraceae bacterium]|nr:hypothetical protein [Solirubrobacteraceae bacterium]